MIENYDTEILPLFDEDANPKIGPAIENGYPIVNGRAVPLVTIVMHKDGGCSIRVGHRWIHNLWPDQRLSLLGAVRRTNGNGVKHEVE